MDLGQVQTRGDEEWMRLFLAVGSLVSRPPPRFYLAAVEENRSNFSPRLRGGSWE